MPEYLDLPGPKMNGGNQCLAFALFTQAKYAGFKKPDIRIWSCPECNADGFNTGMGVLTFTCGAAIVDDIFDEPCGAPERKKPPAAHLR